MEDNTKKYDCKCPVCGCEFLACKSIFQEIGFIEVGHASCFECKTFLALEVDENDERMIAIPFTEYEFKK